MFKRSFFILCLSLSVVSGEENVNLPNEYDFIKLGTYDQKRIVVNNFREASRLYHPKVFVDLCESTNDIEVCRLAEKIYMTRYREAREIEDIYVKDGNKESPLPYAVLEDMVEDLRMSYRLLKTVCSLGDEKACKELPRRRDLLKEDAYRCGITLDTTMPSNRQ